MSSLATACRIPAPQRASVARLPIATACSIPRPVNSLSVARRYMPTVQHARPSTNIASLASSFAAMSVSKPANQAIAQPSVPKPASSLPSVAAPCTKLAIDRIQARRQRVTANLNAAKKRPTAPASTAQSSLMPSRAATPATITPVSILKSRSKPSRVIPPPPIHARKSSTLVSSWMPSRGREPRGTKPYCKGRPRELDCNGNQLVVDYSPLFFFGIKCTCHPDGQDQTGPREWKTTPAEAEVDPARPRVVRFADNLVSSTKTFRPWFNKVWTTPENSTDDSTEADDDAAISAIDNPPVPVAITNPLPGGSNFQSTWQALMDKGFPDDDAYF